MNSEKIIKQYAKAYRLQLEARNALKTLSSTVKKEMNLDIEAVMNGSLEIEFIHTYMENGYEHQRVLSIEDLFPLN